MSELLIENNLHKELAFGEITDLQLDREAITQKLSEYPLEEHPNFTPDLHVEHALHQDLIDPSPFQCLICLKVVQYPEECQKCEKLSCKVCLKKWLDQKWTCPHCRQVYLRKAQINRTVMGVLQKLRFQCQKCPQ